ncbi:MAG: hypothetical protein L0Y78_00075, partial [candidate division NC10 bacterium]|nr:hypothetical protein [candidate division NC10 bacterium]
GGRIAPGTQGQATQTGLGPAYPSPPHSPHVFAIAQLRKSEIFVPTTIHAIRVRRSDLTLLTALSKNTQYGE